MRRYPSCGRWNGEERRREGGVRADWSLCFRFAELSTSFTSTTDHHRRSLFCSPPISSRSESSAYGAARAELVRGDGDLSTRPFLRYHHIQNFLFRLFRGKLPPPLYFQDSRADLSSLFSPPFQSKPSLVLSTPQQRVQTPRSSSTTLKLAPSSSPSESESPTSSMPSLATRSIPPSAETGGSSFVDWKGSRLSHNRVGRSRRGGIDLRRRKRRRTRRRKKRRWRWEREEERS